MRKQSPSTRRRSDCTRKSYRSRVSWPAQRNLSRGSWTVCRRRLRWSATWVEQVSHSLLLFGAPGSPSHNSTDPLSSRTQALNLQLSLLQGQLNGLLEIPAPPTQGAPPTETEPWSSRSAFINWAASAKVDALPAAPREAGGRATEDAVITQLQETMGKTGRQEDATVSGDSQLVSGCCADLLSPAESIGNALDGLEERDEEGEGFGAELLRSCCHILLYSDPRY